MLLLLLLGVWLTWRPCGAHTAANQFACNCNDCNRTSCCCCCRQTKNKSRARQREIHVHITNANTYTHQWHVVSNTNRIYPVSQPASQPGSQSAIYPSIQSYVRPSINASSKAFTNPFISIEMCEDYMFRQTRNCARICQATLTHLPPSASPLHPHIPCSSTVG